MSPQPAVSRSRTRSRRWRPHLPDHTALGSAPVLRIGTLGFLAASFQPALFSRIEILGMRPDVALLVLLMTSLLAGPIAGASMGFGMGLLLDLLSGHTVGLTSLAYVVVGYGIGRLGMLRDPASRAVPLLVGSLGTLFGLLVFGTLYLMVVQGAHLDVAVVGDSIGTAVIGTLLALPVHNRIKRWLAPMLPEEARRRRRRRAYGTRRSSSSDVDVRIR